MPKSPQNRNKEGAPTGGDPQLWKRQLDRTRRSAPAADGRGGLQLSAAPKMADDDRSADIQKWQRLLEHNRLSALAMPQQNPSFAGPGAAGGKGASAAAPMPSPEEINGLVKDAKTLLKLQERKGWPMKIVQIPWVGWLLAPIGLGAVGAMKVGHDTQQAAAAKRLSAASKKYPLEKLPIPYIKAVIFAVRNWPWVQKVEWLGIIGGELLFLIILTLFVSIVIVIEKCTSLSSVSECLLS